jgi:RPA family protein
MIVRETAWRIFAGELNSSTLEQKGEGEKDPSYLVTPLGAMVNRVLVAGVLTEKENSGSEDEPMWKGRIQDVSGNYFINVGRFQPEAAAAMADLDTPSFVAVVGKVKTYTTEDGRTFVTVRPERIVNIDDATRNLWILETAQSTWTRLLKMKDALQIQNATPADLEAKGYNPQEAQGILMALDQYDIPDSTKYLKLIQGSLKLLLPDKDIDLGLPEDLSDQPDEIDMDQSGPDKKPAMPSGDKEDIILRILGELDGDPGAPRDEVDRRAALEGISSDEVEEISNSLMDKGLIFEPKLGFLKKIV